MHGGGMLDLAEVVQGQFQGRPHGVLKRAHVPVAFIGKLRKNAGSPLRFDPNGAISLADVVAGDLRMEAWGSRALAVTAGIECPAVIRALQEAALHPSS